MAGGYRMYLPKSSAQSWIAASTGKYGEHAASVLAPFVSPGSIVLDIGASLGLTAVPLGLVARSAGARLVAFEPVPANVNLLRENIGRAALTDCTSVIQAALGEREGVAEFAVEGTGAGNAAIKSGVDAQRLKAHLDEGGLGIAFVIDLKTLDSFDLSPVSAVKIDVEGFELDVLAGATITLERDRPAIFGEFGQGWMKSRGHPPNAVHQWAMERDYVMRAWPLRRTTWWGEPRVDVPISVGPDYAGGDVLLVPRERVAELSQS